MGDAIDRDCFEARIAEHDFVMALGRGIAEKCARGNPAANRAVVEYFPSYLPMQIVVGGAIADRVAWWQFWASLGWAVGLGLLGLLGFWQRTRIAAPRV